MKMAGSFLIAGIVHSLNERLARLKDYHKSCGKSLSQPAGGALRVRRVNGAERCYMVDANDEHTMSYIPKSNEALAFRLAQQEYDSRVLASVEKEIGAIERLLRVYSGTSPEEIIERYPPGKRKFIIPVEASDEDIVREWRAAEYSALPLNAYETGLGLVTDQGEQVRSKSELIIANELYKNGVLYRYECPLWLDGYEEAYPDFTILNVRKREELYWEHLGLMNNQAYVEKSIRKISSYILNGIYPGENLILTFETEETRLNTRIVKDFVQRYCL